MPCKVCRNKKVLSQTTETRKIVLQKSFPLLITTKDASGIQLLGIERAVK